ncbi:MAG: ATP-binding protein, partial [Cyanobacteria bacterium J06632_22]
LEIVLTTLSNQYFSDPLLQDVDIIRQYGELPELNCFPIHLNQALFNILENAVQAVKVVALDNVKPQINLKTHYSKSSSLIQVEIKDNGPGILPENLPQIFNPFFTTRPVGEGKGLGLSISHQIIVEQHGGHLSCQSEFGKGSCFVVELPC